MQLWADPGFVPDIPTIYLMTGVSSVIGAVMLLALRTDRNDIDRSMSIFAAGVLAMGLGFAFFALRTVLGPAVASTLGYVALGISAFFVWFGTTHLFDRPASPWAAAAFTVVYLFAVAGLHGANAEHALARILLSSAFSLVFLGLAAREAYGSSQVHSLRAAQILLILLVAFAGVLLVRAALFLASGITINADGTSAPGVLRSVFAVLFGSLPFALTVSVLSVAKGKLRARLHKLATTDELTGLVSRRLLHEAGPRLLERPGECIALLMIDLDNFKSVNDRHGHAMGDEMLCHVAALLRGALRADSLIVRYGGDEFCALVPVPDENAAFGVAERLRATIEASPYRQGMLSLPITMSIGVSVYRHGRTLRELLAEADQRAYRAKSQGRNRVVADDLLDVT